MSRPGIEATLDTSMSVLKIPVESNFELVLVFPYTVLFFYVLRGWEGNLHPRYFRSPREVIARSDGTSEFSCNGGIVTLPAHIFFLRNILVFADHISTSLSSVASLYML